MALRRRRIEIDRQQHPGEYPRHVVRQARARRCHMHILLHLHAAGTPPQLVHVAGRMAPGSFVEAGADVDKYILATEEVKASAAWKEWLLPLLNADLRADARAERRVAAAWSAASSVGGMVATGAPPHYAGMAMTGIWGVVGDQYG